MVFGHSSHLLLSIRLPAAWPPSHKFPTAASLSGRLFIYFVLLPACLAACLAACRLLISLHLLPACLAAFSSVFIGVLDVGIVWCVTELP